MYFEQRFTIEQLLSGATAHDALPVCSTRWIRHRLDQAVVALWALLQTRAHLFYFYQFAEECTSIVRAFEKCTRLIHHYLHNYPLHFRQLHDPLMYIASPSTIIPILLLLILIIYYLVSLTGALREANQDLRVQLRRERTESRKKMLREPKADVDGIGGTAGNVMDRWRKVLEASSPVSPNSVVGNMGIGGVLSVGGNEGGVQPTEEDELKNIARKGIMNHQIPFV